MRSLHAQHAADAQTPTGRQSAMMPTAIKTLKKQLKSKDLVVAPAFSIGFR